MLQPYHSIPVVDVHLDPLELAWQKNSVVSNEVARLLKLVESLLDPVLAWNKIRKVIPVGNNDVGQVTKLNEPQKVFLLALEPRVVLRVLLPTLREFLDPPRGLRIPPIGTVVFLKSFGDQAAHRIFEAIPERVQTRHSKRFITAVDSERLKGLFEQAALGTALICPHSDPRRTETDPLRLRIEVRGTSSRASPFDQSSSRCSFSALKMELPLGPR